MLVIRTCSPYHWSPKAVVGGIKMVNKGAAGSYRAGGGGQRGGNCRAEEGKDEEEDD